MKTIKQILTVLFMIPFVLMEFVVSFLLTIANLIWILVIKNGWSRSEKWIDKVADEILKSLHP